MVLPPAPHSTPGRRRQLRHSRSAPNSPPSLHDTSASPLRRGKSLPRAKTRRLVFFSPRCGMSDEKIFPLENSWSSTDDRWNHVTKQHAESHGQDDSTVLKIQPHMTAKAVKYGMPTAGAKRITTLFLPETVVVQNASSDHCKGLPEWLDVVTSKFPHLQHLHLAERSQDETATTCAKLDNDNDDGSISPSKAQQLRRLYILYRLPDLVSLNGNPVTQQERQLAKPTSPFGEKVSQNDWVHGSVFDGLDALEEDEAVSTPVSSGKRDDAVEVSLSGAIKMTDPAQASQNILIEEKVRMPLLDRDEPNMLEAGLSSPLPHKMMYDLDRVEYVSVESSAHCDWGVACGSFSLPYFRPDRREQSKSRFRLLHSSSNEPQKKLAACPKRTNDVILPTEGAVETQTEESLSLILSSVNRSSSDELQMKTSADSSFTASPVRAQKKLAAGGKRDGMLLRADEKVAAPRIKIGLVEHIDTSPRRPPAVELVTLSHSSEQSGDTVALRASSSAGTSNAGEGSVPEVTTFCSLQDAMEELDNIVLSHSDQSEKLGLKPKGTDVTAETVYTRSPLRTQENNCEFHHGSPERSNSHSVDPVGSPSHIPASRSLTCPFPMQFRTRAVTTPEQDQPTKLRSPPRSVVLLPAIDPIESSSFVEVTVDDANVGDVEEIQDEPSSPSAPPRNPPSLRTIETINSVNPVPLVRSQSSPGRLGHRNNHVERPPTCPGSRRRALAVPIRRLKPKRSQSFSKWREKQNARANSIMDNEDDDELSSDDDENMQLD